jgi:hypothetical protein
MDKKQATVTVKNAAIVWMVACSLLYVRIFADLFAVDALVYYSGITAGGLALATVGILIQSVLLHGFPRYHLDEDETLL